MQRGYVSKIVEAKVVESAINVKKLVLFCAVWQDLLHETSDWFKCLLLRKLDPQLILLKFAEFLQTGSFRKEYVESNAYPSDCSTSERPPD